jgi:hypothetical protein
MKVIDEKGKLFGFINIIDLLVIVVIVLLVVGGYKRAVKTKPEMVTKDKDALVVVEIPEVRKATVDAIDVGDELYHYDKGNYFGKIIDKKVENYKEPAESGDGRWILSEVPEKYNVILTVEGSAIETPNFIKIGGEETRVGAQFKMKSKKVAFMGTIFEVNVE